MARATFGWPFFLGRGGHRIPGSADHRRIIETFSSSLQTEDSTETLEFENMPDSKFDCDLEEPEAAIENNGTGGDDPGTGGENHSTTIQEYTTSDSTSHNEMSSSHPSSSSGEQIKDLLVTLSKVKYVKRNHHDVFCHDKQFGVVTIHEN